MVIIFLFQEIFLLVLPFISPCLSADEDYDVLSRDPYQYQFKVDDPKTGSRYEVRLLIWSQRKIFFLFQIAESGSPEIVRGSYRVDLPDGRTQVVQYNVLDKDSGYNVKVNYESINVKKERKREIQKKTFIKPLHVRDKRKYFTYKKENKFIRYFLENIYSESDISS